TQANLLAVLAQVRVDNPGLSPLLIKAVSSHGNAANSPIKDRQTPPFKALQSWIEFLLANNPQLKYPEKEPETSVSKKAIEPAVFAQTQAAAPFNSKPMVISRPTPRSEAPNASPATLTLLVDAPKSSTRELTQPVPRPGTAASEEQQTAGLDAFDPDVFNRLAHPRK